MDRAVLKKVGHEHQLYTAREFRLCGGKADGMRMIELKNLSGLRAEIAADRCMDIYSLEYKGVNLGYMSPAGYVSPQYYQPEDFLRSFTAGFFSTCGLKNIGTGCTDCGEEAVVHGRIGNTPAENVTVGVDEKASGELLIAAGGRMRESILFGEKLQLTRSIVMEGEKNTVMIFDTAENLGGEIQPIEILYHMNMGYPLLDSVSEIIIPAEKTVPRNDEAKKGIDSWMQFSEPVSGIEEQCFYHTLASKDGHSSVMIYNPLIKLGVMITVATDTLDFFTEWKMPGVKDYVLGLEPGNAHVDGRAKMRSDGLLKFIKPGEKINYSLKITVIDGEDEYKKAKAHIASLKD